LDAARDNEKCGNDCEQPDRVGRAIRRVRYGDSRRELRELRADDVLRVGHAADRVLLGDGQATEPRRKEPSTIVPVAT
jgi:hypothetical protein